MKQLQKAIKYGLTCSFLLLGTTCAAQQIQPSDSVRYHHGLVFLYQNKVCVDTMGVVQFKQLLDRAYKDELIKKQILDKLLKRR